MNKNMYVYILSNRSKTLYIGVTNNLERRIGEHKSKMIKGFTSKYNIDLLIYFEEYTDTYSAIAREKELKGWLRSKKISLINRHNPNWIDLFQIYKDSSLRSE